MRFKNANQSEIVSSEILEREDSSPPPVRWDRRLPLLLVNANRIESEGSRWLDTSLWCECWTIHLASVEISLCPSRPIREEFAMDTIVRWIDCPWWCSEEYRRNRSDLVRVHSTLSVCVVRLLDRFYNEVSNNLKLLTSTKTNTTSETNLQEDLWKWNSLPRRESRGVLYWCSSRRYLRRERSSRNI